MRETNYDVVLYGASGFVGQQTVQYFAKHTKPNEVRWAIAGRDRHKLELVKSQVGVIVKLLRMGIVVSEQLEYSSATMWLKLLGNKE